MKIAGIGIALWFRALAALVDDPDSIPITHMAPPSRVTVQPQGVHTFFGTAAVPGRDMVRLCSQSIHTQKSKCIFLKSVC